MDWQDATLHVFGTRQCVHTGRARDFGQRMQDGAFGPEFRLTEVRTIYLTKMREFYKHELAKAVQSQGSLSHSTFPAIVAVLQDGSHRFVGGFSELEQAVAPDKVLTKHGTTAGQTLRPRSSSSYRPITRRSSRAHEADPMGVKRVSLTDQSTDPARETRTAVITAGAPDPSRRTAAVSRSGHQDRDPTGDDETSRRVSFPRRVFSRLKSLRARWT